MSPGAVSQKMDLTLKTVSGDRAGRIALGTLYFGTKISRKQAEYLLESYYEMGGNQLDTAASYANWIHGGDRASEKSIGKWLKQRPRLREKIFLGTKGGLLKREESSVRCNLEKENLREELGRSLKELGTDYVDLYWLHRDNPESSVGEILDTLESFRREGLIRYYGASNWSIKRIIEMNFIAEEVGAIGFSASQLQYGYGLCTAEMWGDRTIQCMDEKSYKLYQSLQIPVYAYSAQSEGYFSILQSKGEKCIPEEIRKKYDNELNRKRYLRACNWQEQSERHGNVDFNRLALEYVLSSPFPTVYIQGGSSVERLQRVMKWEKERTFFLKHDDWKYLLEPAYVR